MELALPVLALGGLFIVSNQNNKDEVKRNIYRNGNNNTAEPFTSMGKQKQHSIASALPNTQGIPQNYPVPAPSTDNSDTRYGVNEFYNPNRSASDYLNQNLYEHNERDGYPISKQLPQHYSLNGNYLRSNDFRHNNMVPFNGGKPKGQIYNNNVAETILDSYSGTGSQITRKIEQAPLFKPEANMQWGYGMPNMSDFYQERVVPGMRNNMVKPFESVKVGPGLGQGYTTGGSGGFNSGMEMRDAWLPKTVDELRTATNPKDEYTLDNLQGPAISTIKNIGILGKVEKNLPDTFYIQSQDRWLTTTGLEKGPRMVATEVMQPSTREETSSQVVGAPSSDRRPGYAPTTFEQSKRTVLEPFQVGHSRATGKGGHEDGDVNLASHENRETIRSTTNAYDSHSFGSGFSSAIGAVIAPIMDILKPSRREETVENMRIYGNTHGGAVPKGYIPDGRLATTLKETTLFTPHGYVGNQVENGAYITQQAAHTPVHNQRMSTNSAQMGVGGNKQGVRSVDAEYRQTNNVVKDSVVTGAARTNMGNMNVPAGVDAMHVNIARVDKDRENNRMWAPSMVIPAGPSVATYGEIKKMPQMYQEDISINRINPEILNAFRENPYTFSLTNCA